MGVLLTQLNMAYLLVSVVGKLFSSIGRVLSCHARVHVQNPAERMFVIVTYRNYISFFFITSLKIKYAARNLVVPRYSSMGCVKRCFLEINSPYLKSFDNN